MIVAVVVLGVVAVAAASAALVLRRHLRRERARGDAAEALAAERSAELERTSAALATSERERLEAEQRRAEADERATRADERATVTSAGFDPQVVWALEQARSERTWRLSIALGPDLDSVFDGAAEPLREALAVEVDAAREEVGAVVELDATLPAGLTPAGSVLVLRAAQELLATVVRRGEETTVRVTDDGRDMLVTVHSVDEHGEPVPPLPLPVPASSAIEPVPDGVRIRNVVSIPVPGTTDDAGPAVDHMSR